MNKVKIVDLIKNSQKLLSEMEYMVARGEFPEDESFGEVYSSLETVLAPLSKSKSEAAFKVMDIVYGMLSKLELLAHVKKIAPLSDQFVERHGNVLGE